MDKGRVKFGADILDDGRHRPVIELENFGPKGETVQFLADFTVGNEDEARKVVTLIHKILSGPQKGLKYDRHGNA